MHKFSRASTASSDCSGADLASRLRRRAERTKAKMNLGIPLSLCFCLLFCLVSGSSVDEKPGNETHHEDEDHHHMMRLIGRFNAFVQNSNKCPPKWSRFKKSCYRYIECPKSFADAEEECQSYGWNSHLVSIHNNELGEFLTTSVVPNEEKGNVWIGGSNVNQNELTIKASTLTDGHPASV